MYHSLPNKDKKVDSIVELRALMLYMEGLTDASMDFIFLGPL